MIYRNATKIVTPEGTLKAPDKVRISDSSNIWLVNAVLPIVSYKEEAISTTAKDMGMTPELTEITVELASGKLLNIKENNHHLWEQHHPEVIREGYITRIKLTPCGGGIGSNEVYKSSMRLSDIAHWFDISMFPKPGVYSSINKDRPANRHGVTFFRSFDNTFEEVGRPIFEEVAYCDTYKDSTLQAFPGFNLIQNQAAFKTVFTKYRKTSWFSAQSSTPSFWVEHADFNSNGYVFRDNQERDCAGAETLCALMIKEFAIGMPDIKL